MSITTEGTVAWPVVAAAVLVEDLVVRYGPLTAVDGVSFEAHAGQVTAVLGPNGAGKTSLLRILLGLLTPSSGRVTIEGQPPARRRAGVGYVPQQRAFDRELPLRGRDLVRLGLDGHRWGGRRLSIEGRIRLDRALAEVGATAFADRPVGLLSGGEQQRLRIAQALVGEPRLLLADEPLLSLDLASQRVVVSLLDQRRRVAGTPVVFVTHDVNPILPVVDRVLYLAGGTWAIGAVDEVMTSDTLSHLYGTEIDVLRVRGRIVVVGAPDEEHGH
jgi:zinc/manganese transport system ATP-binding protein